MEQVQFAEKLNEYSAWRVKLVDAIDMYHSWRKQYDFNDASSENAIRNILHNLASDRLTLAFVAEFSRGKTELINALFFAETGVRLLPSSPGRTTMCPAELFFDREGGNYIRLLDIESRFEETPFADLKQDAGRWRQISLDRDNPPQMQSAFQELVAVKRVPTSHALKLGLFDEAQAAEQGLINPETVEIPRWRHALISFKHPLLEAGLGILDTPGLNALGSEPELTLSMLPNAQAIVFVLAADTGVTKSDLRIWNDHILRATNASKQGLAVVMNKIDTMWDDLNGEEGYEESIRAQVKTSANDLGISEDVIFPVSAKQALLAKLKHDISLLDRSWIKSLEHYFSDTILNQRQKILMDAVLRELGFLLKESYVLTERSYENNSKQLEEFQKLNYDNQDTIVKLTQVAKQQQEAYFKKVEYFKMCREAFQVRLNNLLTSLSPREFDKTIKTYKVQIKSSLTTFGMKDNIKKLFEELRASLESSVALTEDIQQFILKMHADFDTDYGFKEVKPSLFQIKDYQAELEQLFITGENYRASAKTMLTEKSLVIQKLYDTIVLQARFIVIKAHRDAAVWGENVLSPLKYQIFDQKKQIENRLMVMQSASNSKKDFNQNVSRLQEELNKLELQRRELKFIVKEISLAAHSREVT
ncbi:MAG: dynamin family protein [Methylomonas sp.]|jgi:hypothetical protein